MPGMEFSPGHAETAEKLMTSAKSRNDQLFLFESVSTMAGSNLLTAISPRSGLEKKCHSELRPLTLCHKWRFENEKSYHPIP